jgi:putative FmdB family regulatory protein
MPLHTYQCADCKAVFEVLVRPPRRQEPTTCEFCGKSNISRKPSAFAVTHNEVDAIRALDPMYKRMVEDQMAKTPEAEPMRHLNKLTPFDAAKDPGKPIDF